MQSLKLILKTFFPRQLQRPLKKSYFFIIWLLAISTPFFYQPRGTLTPRPTFCPEKTGFCFVIFSSKTLGSHRQRRVCGKTAPRAGKAVITPARRAWVRGGERKGRREHINRQQVRVSGKGTVATGFGPTGRCCPLDSGTRARVWQSYLGGPLGRLLLQRLPSAGVHGWVHGRGPRPRAPQPALRSPQDSTFTLGRGSAPSTPEVENSGPPRGQRSNKQAFATPAQGLSPRATGQREARTGAEGGRVRMRSRTSTQTSAQGRVSAVT